MRSQSSKVGGSGVSASPFRVLGIALVIDELGKEPCMAFRYPTSLHSGTANSHGSADAAADNTTNKNNTTHSTTAPNNNQNQNNNSPKTRCSGEELFFTLSSRQMAKLFRPKHSLCGQSMTLSVGGTVFCFRAVLMADPTSTSSNASSSNTANATTTTTATDGGTTDTNTLSTAVDNSDDSSDDDHLVLFSVVVALAPQVDHISSIPISGWFEAAGIGDDEDYTHHRRGSDGRHVGHGEAEGDPNHLSHESLHKMKAASVGKATSGAASVGSHGNNTIGGGGGNASDHGGGSQHGNTTNNNNATAMAEEESHRAASASFLAIRRVQVSLARLCRVLEREEKRCRYISWQSQRFFSIRAALTQKWEEAAIHGSSRNGNGNGSDATTVNGNNNSSSSTSRGATATKPPANPASSNSNSSPKNSELGNTSNHGPTPPVVVKHRRGQSFSHGLLSGGGGTSTVGVGNLGLGGMSGMGGMSNMGGSSSVTGGGGTGSGMSMSMTATDGGDRSKKKGGAAAISSDHEQEMLEHILAAGPHDEEDNKNYDNGSSVTTVAADGKANYSISKRRMVDLHHGNLGRELVQVFHSLSRNDHYFPPSPSVLSGREGVVYVNRHIAVAVEAVSLQKATASKETINTICILRPYHTLVFPNASPSQLLQALRSSGITAPLQQLLLMVRPSKPLADIAVDANLPVSVTMELANYMVTHSACVAATVLTRGSRVACKRVERIQEFALDFSQAFDDWSISLFLIVSFLTTKGRSLGESMTALTTGDDPIGSILRAGILSSMFHDEDTDNFIFVDGNEDSDDEDATGTTGDNTIQVHPRAEELEEVLYSMAIWLLSHQVLGQMQDYLVLSNTCLAPTLNVGLGCSTNPRTNIDGEKSDATTDPTTSFDEALLRELEESDCLMGAASIVAISWRLGLDEAKLRSWAAHHDKIRIVSRLAAVGDDWGAV